MMTVEYVLLIALFVILMGQALINGPVKSFKNAGPRLGARIEFSMETGSDFRDHNNRIQEWSGPR